MYHEYKCLMKKVRLAILCLLAVFCGLSVFSCVSGLEDGENTPFLAIGGIVAGIVTYILARVWDKRGKLPESVSDRNNDAA